jgi:hypothetical protein
MSDAFLKHTKRQLLNYLKYSEHVQLYDERHKYDVKDEITFNNEQSVKFLAQLQDSVHTNPSAYLYLKELRKYSEIK